MANTSKDTNSESRGTWIEMTMDFADEISNLYSAGLINMP
jgi:hypothetical protein